MNRNDHTPHTDAMLLPRLDIQTYLALNAARLRTGPYRETLDAVNTLGLVHGLSPAGYVVLHGLEDEYAYDPVSGHGHVRGEEVEFEDAGDFVAFVLEMETVVRERLGSGRQEGVD